MNILSKLFEDQIPDETIWLMLQSRYESEDFILHFLDALIENPDDFKVFCGGIQCWALMLDQFELSMNQFN